MPLRILDRPPALSAVFALLLATNACSDAAPAANPCLPGARVCNGTVVMVCDPESQRFTHERICDGETVCLSGACVPRGFADAGTDLGADTPTDEAGDDRGATETSGLDGGPEAEETYSPDDGGADDGAAPEDTQEDGPQDAATEDTTSDTTGDGGATDVEPETLLDADADDTDGSDISDVSEQDDGQPLETVEDIPPETADADVGSTDDGADTSGPPDPYSPGLLLYSAVPNFEVVGDFHDVAWHPSGDYALATSSGGKVVYIEHATSTLHLAGAVPGDITDISALASADGFLVSGGDGDGGKLWRITVDTATPASLVVQETIAVPFGTPVSLVAHPADARIAVVAHSSNNLAYAYLYDPEGGLGTTKGFNASGGVSDAMWANPALFGGSDALITSHGINGADSRSWILNAADLVVSNGWSPGFGNAGAAGWRPGGNYGVVAGWSSNKLYVFDGSWQLGTLPVPTGASPNGVAWRHDGRRGLVVGRVIGSPAYATVVEIRAGEDLTAGYSDGILVNQSIQQFSAPPWNGNSGSQHLLDVAWRPGTPCDEGLIVGTDNSSSAFNPTFGVVIRFWDQDDPACD